MGCKMCHEGIKKVFTETVRVYQKNINRCTFNLCTYVCVDVYITNAISVLGG